MNFKSLEKILSNEPSYRLKQARKAVFSDLIGDWRDATNLPLALRGELDEKAPLFIDGEVYASKDGKTVKAVIKLRDGLKVEAVLMRRADGRNSACLSSQVGCPLGCGFCATGATGFKRNLTADEIIGQYLFLARYLKNNFTPLNKNIGGKKEKNTIRTNNSKSLKRGDDLTGRKAENKITNVVYMGMGEPFLNYENVMESIKILNDKNFIGLGARHISISTSGIVDGIKKLANENLQINLAVSLHAPDDKLRSFLMPINKRYSIKKVLSAVDGYIEKTGRRVMFEYLMIKGINDSPALAKKLASLMKRPLYLVNLIPYNPTDKFKPSSAEAIKKFKSVLEKEGVAVTRRHSFGQDIKAACGQLAGKTETRETSGIRPN